ncbi:MAG: formyltetrahydrofolate deformylase [Helicobacteraceae bacterium]|jgi:formyltetrahydrofolate deformylase|nr:formyltetrahydrofolate deformylase [Helicobacteraceae bacterium]
MQNRYRLLIETADKKGLIHKITGVLLKYELNIEQNNEFVERDSNRFFMRTDISGIARENLFDELREILGADSEIKLIPAEKKRVVIMVTKEHHCLSDLLIRHKYNELEFTIAAVTSNYDNLRSLTENFDIPFHFISHENHSRESHEAELIKVIKNYDPKYIILAKYMRILTPNFVENFANKIINIHHSFLPAFIGANPYKQAYNRGVKIIGATAHFVNNNLDEGPIIAQSVLNVNHTHSAEDMARSGKEIEKLTLAKALRLVFDDRVFIYKNKTIIFES